MVLDTYQYDEAANMKAEYAGLWEQAKLTTMLASAWKLMRDMADEKIGVNSVEDLAWNRTAQREAKKGNRMMMNKEMRKKRMYLEGIKRDKENIQKEMRTRAMQTKEDWMEAWKKLMKMKQMVCDNTYRKK